MKAASTSPSLEERIRIARAERDIAIGYMIGEALNALWSRLAAFPFHPSTSPKRVPSGSLLGSVVTHH